MFIQAVIFGVFAISQLKVLSGDISPDSQQQRSQSTRQHHRISGPSTSWLMAASTTPSKLCPHRHSKPSYIASHGRK
ncbi:hypothetical protein BofuT4_P107230.1 [Botrytis cinerea T4]|uniref:Secreted protein n=1 Tax=Botryotinia fuckeliana (strain T4) TaxID=999810 RepID=G2Y6T7_BOTF4|nr:hypothetical protein BofuT4_P107230.1 [Botrytis cinerea T4]